jgi:hypothetical protein
MLTAFLPVAGGAQETVLRLQCTGSSKVLRVGYQGWERTEPVSIRLDVSLETGLFSSTGLIVMGLLYNAPHKFDVMPHRLSWSGTQADAQHNTMLDSSIVVDRFAGSLNATDRFDDKSPGKEFLYRSQIEASCQSITAPKF